MGHEEEIEEDREEESGGGPVGTATLQKADVAKRHKAFRNIRYDLTEEELASPGVQRMILNEAEELLSRVEKLEVFQDKYYEADKARAVLTEGKKTSTAIDIINGFCIAGGASLMSIAPAFWADGSKGSILLIVGGLFIVCGIAAKAVKI
jgi:hypothetical protein